MKTNQVIYVVASFVATGITAVLHSNNIITNDQAIDAYVINVIGSTGYTYFNRLDIEKSTKTIADIREKIMQLCQNHLSLTHKFILEQDGVDIHALQQGPQKSEARDRIAHRIKDVAFSVVNFLTSFIR